MNPVTITIPPDAQVPAIFALQNTARAYRRDGDALSDRGDTQEAEEMYALAKKLRSVAAAIRHAMKSPAPERDTEGEA